MQYSNLSALTISELKAIAAQLDCTLKGDKRSKQSWIAAIEIAQQLEALPTPTTEEEMEAIMGESIGLSEVLGEIILGEPDCSSEDDNSDMDDAWELVEISHAEQEAIAHDADVKAKNLANLIVKEFAQIAEKPLPAATIATQTSSKKGAVAVIGAILCAIVFVFCAVCTIAHTIVKYAAILIDMFVGGYKYEYDFWYQIQIQTLSRAAV